PEVQRLRLCLFATTPPRMVAERLGQASALLEQYPDPQRWTPDDAAEFGREVLELADPDSRRGPLGDKGRALLLSAFDRLPAEEAEHLFQQMLAVCRQPGPHHECPAAAREMAARRPSGWIAVDWLEDRSSREGEA